MIPNNFIVSSDERNLNRNGTNLITLTEAEENIERLTEIDVQR